MSDADGHSILGRIISQSGLAKVASAFGVSMKIARSPSEMIVAARNGEGVALAGTEPARLIWAFVAGSRRLEIRDYPAPQREWLKSIGCFTEIIAYKTRLFIPPDRATTIIEQISRTGAEWGKLVALSDKAA